MNLTKIEEHTIETERYSVILTIYEDPIHGDFMGEMDVFLGGAASQYNGGEKIPPIQIETLSPEYDSNKDVLIGRCREIIRERYGG